MTTTLAVLIDADGPDTALHRMVLSGLANSYRLVDRDAEVVVTTTTDPERLERLCAGGARAVVIDRPGRLSSNDLAAVAAAAEREDCLLVPAPLYAPRFATTDLLGDSTVELLESIIRGDDLRSALVEQLALLRTVLGPADSVRVLHASESHYVVEASMAEHATAIVLLNGLVAPSGDDEASMHAIGPDRRLVVRVDAGPVARPAEIDIYDGDGGHSRASPYQHALRITLVRLHQLLTTGEGSLTYSLQDLRHDVQLAASLDH